ncbi:MAG: tetratricopeptide repeat protein [Actinomycetota bacterium]
MIALLFLALGLFGVAAAGVLAPLSRGRRASLERLSDPLEDERRSLLRALRELDEDRAVGALREEDYRALKAETEARAVAVLRALAERDGQEGLQERLRDLREARRGRSAGEPRRWVMALVVAASLIAGSIPLLAGSVRSRDPEEAITGDLGPGASAQQTDPLAFFEERVRQHPRDVAARLDLAHRYLDAGRVREAIDQYIEALRLDPENAEAHAHLGLLLFLAGRPRDGLAEVERALEVERSYPEALYIKGLILLRGLGREGQAAAALRAYLEAAPFGAEREAVRELLREIAAG